MEDVRELARERENSGALRELDQNSAVLEVQMCDKNTTRGKWKRRLASTSKKGQNEGGGEQKKAGIRNVCHGKRVFCLRDEEEALEMDNQAGKKNRNWIGRV